ncbi:hypothetical protein V8E36_003779 [Tilletia maclaganii]
MFGEDRSQSPRMASPWASRLCSSLDPQQRGPSPLSIDSTNIPPPPPPTTQQAPLSTSQHSPSLAPLQPEHDTVGNIEYKLKLLPPTRDRFNRLVTQLKWRLLQGGGMAIYEIGVLDDGALVGLSRREMRASLDTLEAMAVHLGARVEVRRVVVVQRYAPSNSSFAPDAALLEAATSSSTDSAAALPSISSSSSSIPSTHAGPHPTLPPNTRSTSNPTTSQILADRALQPGRKSQATVPTLSSVQHALAAAAASATSASGAVESSSFSSNASSRHSSPRLGSLAAFSSSLGSPPFSSHQTQAPISSSPSSASASSRAAAAQMHAASKMFNETYLLRELGAKRRGSRAGPTDIVHLGLLDATQARKWVGGGKRTFSADIRLDVTAASSFAGENEKSDAEMTAAGVPTPTPTAAAATAAILPVPAPTHDKLAAEMALPLIQLSALDLAREIENDRLLEQWEDELKRRRAEAAALAAAEHQALLLLASEAHANGNGDGGPASSSDSNGAGAGGFSFSQRQRRRRGSNHGEVYARFSPAPQQLASLPAHYKEGSGPVRIAGTRDQAYAQRAEVDDAVHGNVDDGDIASSEEDDGAAEPSGEDGSDDGSAHSEGQSDDDDGGFFSFSLSLSDDEDGHIKGGRRKKTSAKPTPKTAGRAPSSDNPIDSTAKARNGHHRNGGANERRDSSPPPGLAQSRSSGSQRRAENRAAVQESALLRADAEARAQQDSRAGTEVLPAPPLDLVPLPGPVPQPPGTGPDEIGIGDSGQDAPAEATAGAEDGQQQQPPPPTPQPQQTTIRFIVEAKVLRKLRKGDVFIDYAGI